MSLNQIKSFLQYCSDKGGGRAAAFFLFFATLWLGCLSVAALCFTVVFPQGPEGVPLLEQCQYVSVLDIPAFAILTFVLLVIILAATRYFLKFEHYIKTLPWLGGATLVSALVMAFWVSRLETQYYLFPDSYELVNAAQALLAGKMELFRSTPEGVNNAGPHFYFHFYPYQAGSLFYISFLGLIFGGASYQLVQYTNVLWTAACIPLMYFLTLYCFNKKAAKLASLFTAVSAPLIFSVVLPYGNSAALFLCFLALTALVYLCRKGQEVPLRNKILATVVFALACALAMLVKATSNIFLIAFMLMALGLLITWNKRVIPAILLVTCLVFQSIPNYAASALENMTGAQFSQGQPKTAWIAMGLRDDNPLNRPGWWSMYPWTVFDQVGEDLADQDAVFKESIKDSFGKFLTQPAYGAKFFAQKIGSEWLDPAFQGLFYSSIASTSRVPQEFTFTNSKPVRAVMNMTLQDSNLLFPYMKAYQLLMFVAAALGSLLMLRDRAWRQNTCVIPVVLVLLAGSACYVLWEAKAVYLLPYFLCCIPLAAGFAERCQAEGFNKIRALLLKRP